MNKLLIFTLTAILVIGAGCSKESIVIDDDSAIEETDQRVISLIAGMPGEEVTTRVALKQNGSDVSVTWEEDDVLRLCFVDGSVKVNQTVPISEITENGKKARFEINVPEDITSPTFDLYGIYGAAEFSTVEGEEHIVVLPSTPWSGASLEEIQNKDITALTFSKTGISSGEDVGITFKHLGSLFKILVDNIGITALDNITEAQLIADTPIWAHKSGGTAKYNLVEGAFVEGSTISDTTLPFYITSTNLAADGQLEFWGWYPPVQGADKAWPAMKLKIITSSGTEYETDTLKPAKTAATPAGMAFYIFATYNAGTLDFLDVSKTLHVPSPGGTLSTLLSAGEQRNIRELTITGTFNQDDWDFLKTLKTIHYLDISGLTNLTIPNRQFLDNQVIEEVRLPNVVTTIYYDAFRNSSLRVCNIPSTVTTIGDAAFRDSKLSGKIVIPSGVKTLYNHNFRNTKITEVTLNEGLTEMRHYAFYNCVELTKINLPSTLKTTQNYIFDGTNITKLVFPASLTNIGESLRIGMADTLYSKNPNPPTAAGSNIGLRYIKYLGVPIGSKEAYETATGWKEVVTIAKGKIEEVDFEALGL